MLRNSTHDASSSDRLNQFRHMLQSTGDKRIDDRDDDFADRLWVGIDHRAMVFDRSSRCDNFGILIFELFIFYRDIST